MNKNCFVFYQSIRAFTNAFNRKNNGEGAGNGDLLEKILLLVKNKLTSEHNDMYM